jgi:hypothetical protein
VRKAVVLVAAAMIGTTMLSGSAMAQGSQTTGQTTNAAKPAPGMVQLNVNTAVNTGLVDKYTPDAPNVALAKCLGDKPTFTSPVLDFSNYVPGPFMGVDANVSADAALKPGTAPGRYPLTISCSAGSYSTTFTVPAPQVSKVPSGAAKAGDGSMAELTR